MALYFRSHGTDSKEIQSWSIRESETVVTSTLHISIVLNEFDEQEMTQSRKQLPGNKSIRSDFDFYLFLSM